jgi:hypothetical protein
MLFVPTAIASSDKAHATVENEVACFWGAVEARMLAVGNHFTSL